jgi:enediyne polyketide synthase
VRQFVSPVRFTEVAAHLIDESGLAIEIGPGVVAARMLRACGHPATLSIDAGGESLAPLLAAAGAAFVLGAPVRLADLAAGRFARPFSLEPPCFLSSPCEQVAVDDAAVVADPPAPPARSFPSPMAGASAADPIAAARQLIAERADLPVSAIRPGDRLLADLHFNSITAAQIVLDLAARLEVPPPPSPTDFAAASIEEIVIALQSLATSGGRSSADRVAGIESWVRTFQISDCPAPGPTGRGASAGRWEIRAAPDHPLRPVLEREADRRSARGTIICLPSQPSEADWTDVAATAREAARRRDRETIVIVHDGVCGGGLAASLAQDAPQHAVALVRVPFGAADASRWILDESIAATGFARVSYTSDGVRCSPRLQPAILRGEGIALTPDDVLVASGGGKGIAAECVLALAKRTGVALGLIGRASPDSDEALAATLSRFRAAGVRVRYERGDVADRAAVAAAVDRIAGEFGPVTGIVHAAGVNRPALLPDLADDDIREVLAAKLAGARHLAQAVDMRRLRLFVAFGSLIARTGMRGEAHYALANEAMTTFVDRLGTQNPECRCLTIEWSVWAGLGMGQRLGRVAALERDGITPLTIDQGVDAFLTVVTRSAAAGCVVISGRFGRQPALAEAPLPLARFIDTPRVHYAGTELVTDAELSIDTDRYLADHVIGGERVFPAVLGLEAMVQAGAALVGAAARQPLQVHDVRFDQPVTVPATGRRLVRLAALTRGENEVEVALRCEATGFAVDHFALRGVFRPATLPQEPPPPPNPSPVADVGALYGELFFQRDRFRRVSGYHELRARRCVAEIRAATDAPYFGAYQASALWLGDPGVRDAVIHAIQACVPLRRLVPTRVDRIVVGGDYDGGSRMEAVERRQDGETYVYDVRVWNSSGRLVERWDGLHLHDIGPIEFAGGMPAVLLEPWLEREWHAITGNWDVQVVQTPFDAAGSGLAAVRQLSPGALRRSDGRPEPGAADVFAAATHDAGATVGLVATAPLGCDLEHVAPRRPIEWKGLIDPAGLSSAEYVARAAAEPLDSAATRIWSSREALRKCGAGDTGGLIVTSCGPPVVRFRSGPHVVSTTRLLIPGGEAIFALVSAARMVPA